MLRVEHLSVRFGEKTVVRDLSFRVREGEWWAVAGPNGAGKSTLAGALGKSVPYSGKISLSGRDVREYSSLDYAKKIGFLSQNHSMVYGFSVEEVISLGRYARRQGFLRGSDPDAGRKMEEALRITGLSEMRRRNMLTLSGGEQQRVFLAQVLCQDPEILVLDEPANHLDLPFQRDLFTLISGWLSSPGRAAVTVMHDLSCARRFATHALLMDAGQCVAQGPVQEVLTPDHLRRVYRMDVQSWMLEMLSQWQEP